MVPYLPQRARRILEIGCGKGAFRTNFGSDVDYWGVEPHRQSAIIASQRLSRVLLGGLFEVADSLPESYFDLIVCNDVIEHIADTEALMRLLRNKLADDGCLSGSIPNVRQSENLYKLLVDKDWKYQSSGILDRTHVRFFTKKSIKTLFSDHGFALEMLGGINCDLEWESAAQPFKRELWAKMLGADSRPLQFGFRARKAALPDADRFFGQELHQLTFNVGVLNEAAGDVAVDSAQRESEQMTLDKADPHGSSVTYHGFCSVCERHQHLLFKRADVISSGSWRETLNCVGCGLPGWARLAHALTLQAVDQRKHPRVFLAEQVTPLAGALEFKMPMLVSRETRDLVRWTQAIEQGLVECEDLQQLTFESGSFDVFGWFNASPPLENVGRIIAEAHRVLSNGGVLLVAGDWGKRALLQEQLKTVLPVDENDAALANARSEFAGFIDVVRACRNAGFSSLRMRTFWSSDLALFGDDLVFLEAIK